MKKKVATYREVYTPVALATTALVCGVFILAAQGCCKYEGCTECPQPRVVTHTVAIAQNLSEYGCDENPPCICPSPKAVVAVRGGDQLVFVNTTDETVTILPGDKSVLTPAQDVTIPPKTSESYIVNVNHGYASGAGFGFDLKIDGADSCPGLPGPSIEFD